MKNSDLLEVCPELVEEPLLAQDQDYICPQGTDCVQQELIAQALYKAHSVDDEARRLHIHIVLHGTALVSESLPRAHFLPWL